MNIPKHLQNLIFGKAKAPAIQSIVKRSILTIWTSLLRPNPEALAKPKFQILKVFGYKLLLLFLVITSFSFGKVLQKPAGWDEWTFDQKRTWRGRHPDPRIPYGLLVDKFRVKEILAKQNVVKVTKTYFATNDTSTISLENLPKTFVMKANNACNSTLKVIDGIRWPACKQSFKPSPATDEILISYASRWLKTPYASKYMEKQYSLVKPMVLFEEYLDNLTMDIEFFCFYGKVKLIKIGFYKKTWKEFYYDTDWNLIKTNSPEVQNPKPEWLEKIIDFSEEFTKNFDHVRCDYYVCGDDLYFGEFTFTTGAFVVPRIIQQQVGSYWLYPDESVVGENFGQLADMYKDDL